MDFLHPLARELAMPRRPGLCEPPPAAATGRVSGVARRGSAPLVESAGTLRIHPGTRLGGVGPRRVLRARGR